MRSRRTIGPSSTASRRRLARRPPASLASAPTSSPRSGASRIGAVDCLLENLTALTAYLHFPAEHWERVRHSNLLERTFGESRRRVKVIGRLPGQDSCLSLVWAVLDGPASAGADSRPWSPASDGCRISAASCSARLSSRRPAERLPALADAARGVVGLPSARSWYSP